MTIEKIAELAGLIRVQSSSKTWYGAGYAVIHEDRILKYILDSPILMRNVINKLIDE